MQTRTFGNTQIVVPVLGLGAGQIGSGSIDENEAGSFLNRAVDLGLSLIDTARGYGLSEERIGRHLSWRRNDFILSTKVGYGIPGFQDWTYDGIVAGVDHALRVMRTDYIDIVHLHSCPRKTLEQEEVIHALLKSVREGKVRVAAYSGENEALDYALHSDHFGGLMSSVSVFDQRSVDRAVRPASAAGAGYIAKRPIGNAPWRYGEQPYGHYCEEYWRRMKAMDLDFGSEWPEIALRFAAFTPGISCAIVGTTNLDHIKKNIDIVSRGPLPDDVYGSIRTAFAQQDHNWIGQT